MGVTIREKTKGSNQWWVFVNSRGRRTSRKVGTTAQSFAGILRILRLTLSSGRGRSNCVFHSFLSLPRIGVGIVARGIFYWVYAIRRSRARDHKTSFSFDEPNVSTRLWLADIPTPPARSAGSVRPDTRASTNVDTKPPSANGVFHALQLPVAGRAHELLAPMGHRIKDQTACQADKAEQHERAG